ncbi:hypothetical protein PGT21_031683 [Puccinia graminis f. sp. tritici]|uniref:Uncharacterized protein n=1 Tax=Puccinia graminis f. sp. tritici TaxID=56615 RepID=A0A5B0PJY6_PUCGR|nr:hypothetical protein PGT21_031683 [Puccinia graminis f. sp. tritici]
MSFLPAQLNLPASPPVALDPPTLTCLSRQSIYFFQVCNRQAHSVVPIVDTLAGESFLALMKTSLKLIAMEDAPADSEQSTSQQLSPAMKRAVEAIVEQATSALRTEHQEALLDARIDFEEVEEQLTKRIDELSAQVARLENQQRGSTVSSASTIAPRRPSPSESGTSTSTRRVRRRPA